MAGSLTLVDSVKVCRAGVGVGGQRLQSLAHRGAEESRDPRLMNEVHLLLEFAENLKLRISRLLSIGPLSPGMLLRA